MSREMIDSNAGWIGSIPSEWSAYKLLYALERPIFDGPHETPTVVDNGIPFISVDSVNDTKNVDLNVCKKFISEEDFNEYYKKTPLKQGDVLFTKAATIGKTAIVDDRKYMVWSPLAILRSGKHVNNEYLYYVLNCPNLIDYTAHFLGNSATQINVGMRELERAKLPVPPLSEQRQIVHFLDRKCSAIDTAIEKTKESIEKLEEYKKAVITKAVTKGLNPDAKMKDSGIEWIGEVPEGWEVKRLRMFYGRRIHKNKGLQEKNLLSLSYGNVIRKSIDTKEGLLPESFDGYNIVEKDDIVIRGTDLQNDHRSLRTGLVTERGIITSAYMTLMPVSSEANSEYFHYLLHCYDVEKVFYAMGGGLRQGLDFWEFSRMMVIEPPKAEQDAIVQYINDKCRAIDALIKEKQTVIDKWTEYKKSLIYYAITGKIDCRNEVCE
jgi:type I restriction enzyme S subunit